MRKFYSSIVWLEAGIDYYRTLLGKMMHKEVRRTFRENALEFEKAIEILRSSYIPKEGTIAEELKAHKINKRVMSIDELKAWATELQNKAEARPKKAESVLREALESIGYRIIEEGK